MENNYKELFNRLEQFEPSKNLRADILTRIYFEKKRSSMIRLMFFGIIAIISFEAMVPSFQYVAREFSQSGFYEYLSLLFSDSATVLSAWKEFSLSLVESMPLAEITIFLAILFVFLFSVKLATESARGTYKLKSI